MTDLTAYLTQRFQWTADVSGAAGVYAGLASAAWRLQIRPQAGSPVVVLDFASGGSPQNANLTAVFNAGSSKVVFRAPASLIALIAAGSYAYDFGFTLPGADFERVDGGTIQFLPGVTLTGAAGAPPAPSGADDTVKLTSTVVTPGTWQAGVAGEAARAMSAEAALTAALIAALPKLDNWINLADVDASAAFARARPFTTRVYATPGKIYTVGNVTLDGMQFDGRGCVIRDAPGASFCFRLTGYMPGLRDVTFQDQGNVAKVTTNSGGFSSGASSIALASGSGFATGGQLLLIQGNGDLWEQTQVAGISSNTVTPRDNTSEAGAAGLKVAASFGLVHLTDSQNASIVDLTFVNTTFGLVISSSSLRASADVSRPFIRNLRLDGARYCGVSKHGNVHDVDFDFLTEFEGATDVFNYVSDGTAGSFDCIYKVDLIRDVTVLVNGVVKTYGTDWTYIDAFHVAFLSGHYPANGAAVQIQHYHAGVRSWIEDQRGVDPDTGYPVTAGGNDFAHLKFLKSLVGVELQSVSLSNYDNLTADTNQFIGVLLNNCSFNTNFNRVSSTWARQSVVAYNSSSILLVNLTTDLTPSNQVTSFSPVTGPEIWADGTSRIDIDLPSWSSPSYTYASPGTVNLIGGQRLPFFSITSISGGSSAYLTPTGQSPTVLPLDILDRDCFIVGLLAFVNIHPGGSETATFNVIENADTTPNLLFSFTITGSSYGGTYSGNPVAAARFGTLSVQAVYSSGAAASIARGYLIYR